MTSKTDKYALKKRLVIVESPAKCSKIEEYLGDSYKCIATYGHLCNISSLKDIDIQNNFQPTYSMIDDPIKKAQCKRIQEEIKACSEVILASDGDREGEAIAFHVCRLFGLPIETTKRILFYEITRDALQKAILSPTTVNMSMVYSQQARQILDILVGFTVSPMLWKLIQRNNANALSAGRCQTPALKLVYDNYVLIKNIPGKKVYNTTGYFTKLVLPFDLNKEYENENDMEYFMESSANHDHIFTREEPKQSIKHAPTPFTTSRLQQVASNVLHYSPKDTMKGCQKLYEMGLITYMRTDSVKYSAEFIASCKEYIETTYGQERFISPSADSKALGSDQLPSLPKAKKSKPSKKTMAESATVENIEKVAPQEAHEAIRPTNIRCTPGVNLSMYKELSARETKLYDLIWANALESLMADATFSVFHAYISAAEEARFVYRAEQIVFPGWLIVTNKFEQQSKEYSYLLALKQGATVEYKRIDAKQTIKSLHMHYTEAKLVSLLEENGIGRPSTYASLVDKIQDRNYVKKEDVMGLEVKCTDFALEEDTLSEKSVVRIIGAEKGKLVIQPLGVIVMEFLQTHFHELFNYEYTNKMEKRLDTIATDGGKWYELCAECNDMLSALTGALKNEKKVGYAIDETHTYIIGKNGPVIKYVENGETHFKPVKKDIDMQKLERGEYDIEELVESPTNRYLGKYKGDDLILKKGKYGMYVTYGENKRSLSALGNRPIENITYAEVFVILEEGGLLKASYSEDQKRKKILREINSSISIRDGKWGPYVYYQTTQMKTPAFYDMKTFEKDTKSQVKTCDIQIIRDWIKSTHNIG